MAFFFVIYTVHLIHFIPLMDDIFDNRMLMLRPVSEKNKSLKGGEYGARHEFDHQDPDHGFVKFQ